MGNDGSAGVRWLPGRETARNIDVASWGLSPRCDTAPAASVGTLPEGHKGQRAEVIRAKYAQGRRKPKRGAKTYGEGTDVAGRAFAAPAREPMPFRARSLLGATHNKREARQAVLRHNGWGSLRWVPCCQLGAQRESARANMRARVFVRKDRNAAIAFLACASQDR